jgi:hypothetical protein
MKIFLWAAHKSYKVAGNGSFLEFCTPPSAKLTGCTPLDTTRRQKQFQEGKIEEHGSYELAVTFVSFIDPYGCGNPFREPKHMFHGGRAKLNARSPESENIKTANETKIS